MCLRNPPLLSPQLTLSAIFPPAKRYPWLRFPPRAANSHSASESRSASGHLEIEQEEWLVGTEQSVSRGTPVTLLEGSAGVIGYVYETWRDDVKPWSHSQNNLYNKEFKFDGDELFFIIIGIKESNIANEICKIVNGGEIIG